MNAAPLIHSELTHESRRRVVRSTLLFVAMLAMLGIFLSKAGLHSASVKTIAFGLNGVVLLTMCYVGACSTQVRISDDVAYLWSIAAPVLPLTCTDAWSEPTPFLPSLKCALLIAAIGAAVLLGMRLGLGSVRRRFGGARILQGAVAALTGALAVGLVCPCHDALHLTSHAVGAALVSFVVYRAAL
jgi:hypothetical protein